jgi:hypothetical protein
MDRWIRRLITVTVIAIIASSIGWLSTCSFYVLPKLVDTISRTVLSGKTPPAYKPVICEDASSRAIGELTALLATLLGIGHTRSGNDQ